MLNANKKYFRKEISALIIICIVSSLFTGCIDDSGPDTDSDGVTDGIDIDPDVDVIVALTFIKVRLEDEIDPDRENEEVYFKIEGDPILNLKDYKRTPNFEFPENEMEVEINYTFLYNIPDDHSIVHFKFTLFDDESFWTGWKDEKLDISSKGAGCDIKFNVIENRWWGDTDTGFITGENDGEDSDTPDASVWFTIESTCGQGENLTEALNATINEMGIEIVEHQDILEVCYNQFVRKMQNSFYDELFSRFLNFIKVHPGMFPILSKYAGPLGVAYSVIGIWSFVYFDIINGNNDIDLG